MVRSGIVKARRVDEDVGNFESDGEVMEMKKHSQKKKKKSGKSNWTAWRSSLPVDSSHRKSLSGPSGWAKWWGRRGKKEKTTEMLEPIQNELPPGSCSKKPRPSSAPTLSSFTSMKVRPSSHPAIGIRHSVMDVMERPSIETRPVRPPVMETDSEAEFR